MLIDKLGNRSTPTIGADGRYHLTLPPSTDNSDPRDSSLYLVGGSPIILQETGVAVSATPPTAIPTPTSSITSTALASPTPTPFGADLTSTTGLTVGESGPAAPVPALPAWTHALYFPTTGHNVAGAFRTVFSQEGGVAAFGYPRTEAIHENGLLIQYFQNVELQCATQCRDPSYTATVTLNPIGATLLGSPSPYAQAQRQIGWGDSIYFAATSHNISGPFLDYWRSHDGVFLLGMPLSEAMNEVSATGPAQGYTLQYFQNGALAFRPVGPNHAFVVVPEPLGDQVLRQRGFLQ